MRNDYSIALNFLALKQESFEFKVFRKEYKDTNNAEMRNLYHNSLLIYLGITEERRSNLYFLSNTESTL